MMEVLDVMTVTWEIAQAGMLLLIVLLLFCIAAYVVQLRGDINNLQRKVSDIEYDILTKEKKGRGSRVRQL